MRSVEPEDEAALGARAAALLGRIGAQGPIEPAVAVVVAHPDDETIGLGGTLARFADLTLIHLTDGAPRELDYAAAAAYKTREAYRDVRRGEVTSALGALDVRPVRRISYEAIDQEALQQREELTERLSADLMGVDAVLTHALEGGHSDHDACALIVQAACERLRRMGGHTPCRLEFAGYHREHGILRVGAFRSDPACPEVEVVLSPCARRRKEAAYHCFSSQTGNVGLFPIGAERFRVAPTYSEAAEPG